MDNGNSLIVLFGASDFYLIHLISVNILQITDNGYMLKISKNRLGKIDRMILTDFTKAEKALNKLGDRAFYTIKNKYSSIIKGLVKNKKLSDGYAASIVGLALFDAYLKITKDKSRIKIHPNRIHKILDLMEQRGVIENEGKFSIFNQTVINSFNIADLILKQLNIKLDKN